METTDYQLARLIILGSKSARRKEILGYFDLPFIQTSSDFDEDSFPYLGDPKSYVKDLALEKARCLALRFPNDVLITADTTVSLDNKIFNKPRDTAESREMLRTFSGQCQSVFTGVCVSFQGKFYQDVEETKVYFNELSDKEIERYTKTFHTLDKAGGYAIQKSGSLLVKRIEGCYWNVVGLPISLLRSLLLMVGIDLWEFIRSDDV